MASTTELPVSFKRQLSVQELAKEPTDAVPQHYVRLHQQPPQVASNGNTRSSFPIIPTIDMKNLVTSSEETTQIHELEKLHSTCKDLGFFQLVNHGVSSSLVEKLKYEIEEFFKLPFEEKIKYKRRPGEVEGFGQTLLVSDDQKLDWCDKIFIVTNPINVRKQHLLPEFPPSLRDTLETYLSELQKLAKKLFELIAKALKIDVKEMEDMFEDGMQAVRIGYYPPCPQPELVMGIAQHSDSAGLTILLQVNEVDGLEIYKDGVWIPVNFLPDAFVVNVGDILEIFSNGAYNSPEHRATVNSMKERMSIAMFFNSKYEAEVGPAPSLINPNNPPLYKKVVLQKYMKDFFNRKLDGKTYFSEEMKIKN